MFAPLILVVEIPDRLTREANWSGWEARTMNMDNVLNVMEQTEQKHSRFLVAWKRGVVYLGAEFSVQGVPLLLRTRMSCDRCRKW